MSDNNKIDKHSVSLVTAVAEFYAPAPSFVVLMSRVQSNSSVIACVKVYTQRYIISPHICLHHLKNRLQEELH